jgi:hypothetical protein
MLAVGSSMSTKFDIYGSSPTQSEAFESNSRELKSADLRVLGFNSPFRHQPKNRVGRGLQRIRDSENPEQEKARDWACDALVTGKRPKQANCKAQPNFSGWMGSPRF